MDSTKTNVHPPDYTHIQDGLVVGSILLIRGRVSCSEPRFHISLQMEKSDDSDIALYFNPRNDATPKSVVRNSFENGCWQCEETDIASFPFNNGVYFAVTIIVRKDDYIIGVNGKYYLTFQHRLCFHDVRYMKVSPGADYYEIAQHKPCHIPYDREFHGGLQSGQSVKVIGFIHDDAERFEINFNYDEGAETIALHFNPRPEQRVTVLNSRKCNQWGTEETDFPCFLFDKGEMFTIIFILVDDRFKIFVNGKYFTSYDYNGFEPARMQFLQIRGDVTLMDVRLFDILESNFKKPIGGLDEGDIVFVKGVYRTGGDRLGINLLSGDCSGKDIVLHFNPRRSVGQVILNSMTDGVWQIEEIHPMPDCMKDLGQDTIFYVDIFNKSGVFKIFINGVFFANFNIRGNISDVIAINGNLDADFYGANVLHSVDSPHIQRCPTLLTWGPWDVVTGIPTESAERFQINLQSEDCTSPRDTIAFYYSPRFDPTNATIRNSFQCGGWETEEREECCFPFERNALFKVHILATNDDYKVFVNGKRHIQFAHRVDRRFVRYIMLAGDCDFQEPEFY